jgi:proteasome lid subunit RPN8/RPN11
MNEQLLASALDHAIAEAPMESCGLEVVVKGRRRYWPCRNIAANGQEMFVIDPEDYAAAEDAGEIVSVIHSHPHTPSTPSQADRVACERSGLPWWIVNPNTRTWDGCCPVGYQAPLVGREYAWSVLDCWTLVRDWYALEWDLKLPDWQRPTPDQFEVAPMFEKCFKAAGFYEVSINEATRGDALLMALDRNDGQLNHVAVYLGDQQILHHVRGRLSSRDLLGGYYLKQTGRVVRHESR